MHARADVKDAVSGRTARNRHEAEKARRLTHKRKRIRYAHSGISVKRPHTPMIHIPISIRPRHGCLLLLLVVVTLFRAIPHWASLYTLHIYPLIARCIAPASSLVPFSLGDCFIAGSVLWLVLYPICARCIRRRRWKPTAFRMAEYLVWIYVWFYAA